MMQSIFRSLIVWGMTIAVSAGAADLSLLGGFFNYGEPMPSVSFDKAGQPRPADVKLWNMESVSVDKIPSFTATQLYTGQKFQVTEDKASGVTKATGKTARGEIWHARLEGDIYASISQCFAGQNCVTATRARCDKARDMVDVKDMFELAQLLKKCDRAASAALRLDDGAKAASVSAMQSIATFAGDGKTYREVDTSAGEFLLYFASACENIFANVITSPGGPKKVDH